MRRVTILLIISILIPVMVSGVGYSPTTIYGQVIGEGKYSIAVSASDAVTGEPLDVVFDQVGNTYVAGVTLSDNGNDINFKIQVNTREGPILHKFTSKQWDSHMINFTLPGADKEAIVTARSSGGRGPRYDEFTRDSEGDIDDFIRKYDIVPPEQERPETVSGKTTADTQQPVEIVEFTKDDKLYTAAFVLVLSIFSIAILTKRHKNSKPK